MDHYDSVDNRLSALAEWLKSSANGVQESRCNDDANANKLYQNHVTYLYHPYANFAGQYANNGFATISNKPQRERTTFTESHLRILEQCFNEVKHPDTNRRQTLAKQLGLPVKTIQIWFQNRRARERKCVRGKRNSGEDWGNFFGQGKDVDTIFNLGQLTDCDIAENTIINNLQILPVLKLGSTTNNESLESGAATVVQEIDSSRRYEMRNNTDAITEDEQIEKEFAIIHIPDEQSKLNTNQDILNPICANTTADTLLDNLNNCQTNGQEIVNEFSVDSIEQQFASAVENLDLDLIVKTYEVLQSSENVDGLIENWLAESSDEQDQFTLEENLKRFIEFCKKV